MYKLYYNIFMFKSNKHILHKKSGLKFRKNYIAASIYIDIMIFVMLALIIIFPIMFALYGGYYYLAMMIASVWYLNTLHNYRKYIFVNQKGVLGIKHKNEFMSSVVHRYGIRYDHGLLTKLIVITFFQWSTVFTLIYPFFIPLGEFDITETWHILAIVATYVSWGGLFLIIWFEFLNAYHKFEVEHLEKNKFVKYVKMFHAYWMFGNMWNIITDYQFYVEGNENLQPGYYYEDK